jgi:hypothetical protein
LEATLWQKNEQIGEGVASLEQNKINCRLECDTHKKERVNSVETAQENNEKNMSNK